MDIATIIGGLLVVVAIIGSIVSGGDLTIFIDVSFNASCWARGFVGRSF